ncbi:MAG: hypothetical protein Q9225_007797 [Loekoesia sp. 1 TL-2023]
MASTSSPPHPAFKSPSGSRNTSTDDDSSPSQLPYVLRSPPSMSTSPRVASKTYVQQYQSTLEHQRRAFDSERVMWDIERKELVEKIAALEESLRQHQALPAGRRSASAKSLASEPSTLGSLSGLGGARYATSTSGNEVWRGAGGKSDAQPTRTFSESATYPRTITDRLPPITENVPPPRSLSESLNQSISIHRPSVVGPDAQKHFDGINFKSTSAAIPHSAPPAQPFSSSHSSSRESPGMLKLPSVEEEPDNLTKDAGHTPLARTVPGLDGTTSAVDSDLPTPLQTEQQRPPLEPRASIAKIPSERSDSYFPLPADDFDQDPELRGQLGLKNDAPSDHRFLNKLNSKLAKVAETSTPPAASQAAEKFTDLSIDEDESFIQPEPEPKLRIKRSMNFGSQLGGNFGPQP